MDQIWNFWSLLFHCLRRRDEEGRKFSLSFCSCFVRAKRGAFIRGVILRLMKGDCPPDPFHWAKMIAMVQTTRMPTPSGLFPHRYQQEVTASIIRRRLPLGLSRFTTIFPRNLGSQSLFERSVNGSIVTSTFSNTRTPHSNNVSTNRRTMVRHDQGSPINFAKSRSRYDS